LAVDRDKAYRELWSLMAGKGLIACADCTGLSGMTLYAHALNPLFSECDSYTCNQFQKSSDSFEKAQQKAKEAEEESDLQTDADVRQSSVSQKRKHR